MLGDVLAPYRRIFGVPHLPGLLTWSMLGRLHFTGTALAMTFLVAGWTGSYTIAGVVTGALTIGMAIGAPLRGRSIDRRPAGPVLLLTGTVYTLGIVAIAVLPAWAWPAAPVLALVSGMVSPPVNSVARVTWARLPDATAREATFAVESTLTEVLFVIGPMLAAILVSVVNARVAVATCGALALLGSAGFVVVLRRAGLAERAADVPAADQATTSRGSVLRTPGLLPVLGVTLLLVAALASVDMVLVAWARDRGTPGMAGVLAAVWAIGSAVGGVILAARIGRQRFALRVAATAGGLALLVPVLPPVNSNPQPWLICAVLVVGGMAIAPTFATGTSRLASVTPADRRGEAFGWLTTASTTGGAAAAPVIGAILDRAGPAPAAALAALLVGVAALLARTVPQPAPARIDLVTPEPAH